jgi:DNA repair protein RecN (Recombination protein N)
MLMQLIIKNIVLIKELKIDFNKGFIALTGETGAGKSILLDSLSLLLGDRANYSLIRNNEDQAEVIGVFDITKNTIVPNLLKENYIDFENEIIIKRIIGRDGKSKSLINDVPVSLNLLKQVGENLVDIHAQFDNHKLFNPNNHRAILDSFLNDKTLPKQVFDLYHIYKDYQTKYEEQKKLLEDMEKEKEYLEYSLQELIDLKPKEKEESILLEQKIKLQKNQKLVYQIKEVDDLIDDNNILPNINKILKQLTILQGFDQNNKVLSDTIELIENSYTSLSNGFEVFNDFKDDMDDDGSNLGNIEERIMDLRSIAKKHRILADDLYNFKDILQDKLNSLNNSQDILGKLELASKQAYDSYIIKAKQLSEARKESALNLDLAIIDELKFLKLNSALFNTNIEETQASAWGIDKVCFKVKTNMGGNWGDLNKVASGGEMARLMLALKIVISESDTINTIIFDEIDIGVGGDVAGAIGNRLLYLSKRLQTIAITHSHQVASIANYHFKVSKFNSNGQTFTNLELLNKAQRVEEIARMLSGAQITPQARATAMDLLGFNQNDL